MIKNIKCCHLLQKIANYRPKFGTEVKMKIQITIARNGHFKRLYCLYVLPSVDKNHNYSSKIWDWSKVSTTKHLCKKLVTLKKVLSAAICWKKYKLSICRRISENFKFSIRRRLPIGSCQCEARISPFVIFTNQ